MSWRASVWAVRRQLYSISRRNASTTASDALISSSETIHTLRALLRECTYLPDPQARSYVSQHILSRYRASKAKQKDADADTANQSRQLRLQAQQRAAHSSLNQLRRANGGEWTPLLKALLLTYGRIGKRRWELMRPLLPASGQDGKNVNAGRARTRNDEPSGKKPLPSHEKKPLPSLTPQLHALLLSHARVEPPTLTRPNPSLKKLAPDVPELNSWLRPMPQSRVRNLTKKWYRSLLERVLPPLPKDEWERLRRLAHGKVVGDMVVERRARPVENADADGLGISPTLKSIVAGKKTPMQSVKRDIHRITPRFMQRLWAQVFMQCPMMEWDSEKNRWDVVWGEHA